MACTLILAVAVASALQSTTPAISSRTAPERLCDALPSVQWDAKSGVASL